MLRRLIGEDIEIAVLAEPGLPHVLADRSQIEQVILNQTTRGGTLRRQSGLVAACPFLEERRGA
jgi:hypothetical protein